MAIAFDANLGNVTNAATLTTSAAAASGSRIVMLMWWFDATVTASGATGGGLTWAVDHQFVGGGGSHRGAIISAHAPSGMASSTVLTPTFSGGSPDFGPGIAAASFTGIASSSYLDTTSTGKDDFNETWTTNNLVTTNADDLLIGFSWSEGSVSHAATGPATEIHDWSVEGSQYGATVYRIVSSASTYTVGGVWSGTVSFQSNIGVAYKASGAAPAYPTVVSTAETAVTTAGTNHTITLPASIASTDLVLITMDIGSTSATLNALTDWGEILDESAANGLKILWYTGAGVPTSPTFVSSGSTRSATIAWRISGADKTITPTIGTTSTGTSATPDPPASAAPPSSKDYLFIAMAGMAGEEVDDDTWGNTPPTDYLPSPPLQKACGTAGSSLGGLVIAASRQLTTGSAENPGTFGVDVSAAWRSQTITVHPAPVVAAGIPNVTMAPPVAA